MASLALLALAVLVPLFLAHLMLAAVARLGLPPELALIALIGIFAGGMVNVPVKRIEREEPLAVYPLPLYGLARLFPGMGRPGLAGVRQRYTMTIAVNLGGCVIPCLIAFYEIARVISRGPGDVLALAAIAGLNVLVCYRLARPIPGLGIAMPALVPPLLAAIPSLLLIPDFAPPVAFVAGVLGPLIGADLLHLNNLRQTPTGFASIGGAGTFDGIVLSGMLAALLA